MTTSTITMLLVDADDTIAAIERARDALERAKVEECRHCCFGDLCPYASTARADAAALLVIDSFLSAARAAAEVA